MSNANVVVLRSNIVTVQTGVQANVVVKVQAYAAPGSGSGTGSVTSVTSANSDISITNPTTTPLLTLNSSITATASTIPKRDSSGNLAGNITGSSASFTGSLGGDVTGTQTTTIVGKIQGVSVSTTAPTSGQVLQYNGTSYVPATINSAVWGNITGTLSNQTDLQNALNAKQNTLTTGNITESTSSVLTITGGTSSIIGAGVTIQVKQASGTQSGYLSSTDWTAFNNKQASLGYTPAHSGANSDITSLTGLTTPLTVAQGGTGINGATAANGTILIGNGTGFNLANLTAGSNISITNNAGGITISSSASTTLAGLSDVALAGQKNGDLLQYNGTKWQNWTSNYASVTSNPYSLSIPDLTTILSTSKTKLPSGITNLNKTIVTTFQSGHGWTSFGTGTISDDTATYSLGSQSVKVVTPGNGTETGVEKLSMTSMDLTAKMIAVQVEVDSTTYLNKLTFKAGDSTLANYYSWTVSLGNETLNGVVQTSITDNGNWRWIYLNFGDASKTGTPSRSAITGMAFGVVDTNQNTTMIARINAVEVIPEPSALFPNGVVSITFDDAFASQYTLARPKLDQYGYRASAFIIHDLLDTVGSLTSSQLSELRLNNSWEVHGHAWTANDHGNYPTLTQAQLEADLIQMKNWCLANGYDDGYAYPQGYFNNTVVQTVQKYFSFARATIDSTNETFPPADPYRLHSVQSIGGVGGITAAQCETLIANAKANKQWLILTFHNITTTAPTHSYECIQSDYNAIIDYINSQGIEVVPIGEVLKATDPNVIASGANGQVLTMVNGNPSWANATTGFANPMTTAGDMIVATTGGTATRIGAGTNGQILEIVSGVPTWTTPAGGGTGITSLNGLTNATQTFANDTNVTITSAGSTHTIGWSGTLSPARGGTGVNSSTASNGQLLIGNGTGFALANLTAGSNITITNSAGGITIAASASSGMSNPMTTLGDIITGGASGTPQRLGVGSNGQVLTVVSGVPAWQNSSGGGGASDGWSALSETWTWASFSTPTGQAPQGTFTTSGDKTTTYSVGDKIKFTNNAVVVYAYIIAVSYSNGTGLSTVTYVTDKANNVTNSAITNNYYSKSTTPNGFPVDMNYVPVMTAATGTVSSVTITDAHFSIIGGTCYFTCYTNFTLSNNTQYVYLTPPVALNNFSVYNNVGTAYGQGNFMYYLFLVGSSKTIGANQYGAGTWTSGSTFLASNGFYILP